MSKRKVAAKPVVVKSEPDVQNMAPGLLFELSHQKRVVFTAGMRMGFCPYALPLADSVIAMRENLKAKAAAKAPVVCI